MVEVTLEELAACGWREVVESASPRDCLVYAQRFSAVRSEAERTGDLARAALGLLEHVCSPMLCSDNDEVFAPRELVDNLADQLVDTYEDRRMGDDIVRAARRLFARTSSGR